MARKTKKQIRIEEEELAHDRIFQIRTMDVNWVAQHYKPEEKE